MSNGFFKPFFQQKKINGLTSQTKY